MSGIQTESILAEPLGPQVLSLPSPAKIVECEILIAGGGLSGTAAAYEALLAGRTVCLTEITDWIGGQISSQGTSALDEAKRQRSLLYFPQGYNELRTRIEAKYGKLNPGSCWVSVSCFIPMDAQALLWQQLEAAARQGGGRLQWFPSTVIKELSLRADGRMIKSAIAIQHNPAPGAPPLNTYPLSQVIEDIYRSENSSRFTKQIIRFIPQKGRKKRTADWYVIEATETGEIIALADVPYRLGLDPRSYRNPSSPVTTRDPYCTQGFTYTFAMEQTEQPQLQKKPIHYSQYAPYYGSDPNPNVGNFDAIFTYRRIWSPQAETRPRGTAFNLPLPAPGDISMQNWVWGNDYRPGTEKDNLIYTREQLHQTGQLSPGRWLGGLRVNTLHNGEQLALGYYYWLVAGTTDSQRQEFGSKQPHPNHRLLKGLESPMGTLHGLSKYPYIRESRRIIGRPFYGYDNGFSIDEIDISRRDYRDNYYRQTLSDKVYRDLWIALAGLEAVSVIEGQTSPDQVSQRTRSTIYPDSVGISQYAIDFHPCMTKSPPEAPGNREREGVRQGHGPAYPAQIPLRAMIPQKIDNLLVTGKSIAASNIAAAAYRVHSFEWSSGSAAGTTVAFAMEEDVLPYQLVDNLPGREPLLEKLRQRLERNGNPTAFPDTSIFNLNWEDWNIW
ncbi:FAD-binding protein [Leptolyngbya sp. 'hensonii']|nr:FAD-dependent oxidoreductase [Leptolyngbya sp. 'hensonii']OLP16321.1 FAD-binding protein [Leptolyngbya sp. 'hensonii']